MVQQQVNDELWKICENFKNKTEIKKNYIIYISALLYLKYNEKVKFEELYKSRNTFYIARKIDEQIEKMRNETEDKNIFSNITFSNIEVFRDLGEKSIICSTIVDIYNLTNSNSQENIAKAYEYVLNLIIDKEDIIKVEGEFNTPPEITNLMSEIVMEKNYTNVFDPTAGSGNFLISATKNINCKVYGNENNIDNYNILKTRFLLKNIDNTNILYRNNYNNMKFDAILSNPPFSDKSWEEIILKQLNENGRMAIILPHGVLFRESEKEIRTKLIENNYIEAIIGLPENLFHYTRMSVIIMVLSKKKNDKRILFIDASDEYKSGKRNNILTRENQNKIRGTYKRKIEVENYSHLASFVEITNNNYILTIKKYVQKKLKRKKIDRNELIQKVKKLEKERNILEENINDVLETLNYKEIIELQRVEKKDTDYVVDYQQIGNRMNITQEMLAEKLSISLKYISRIEMGIGTVNLVTLVKICKILDMDLDELLSNE